MLNAIKLFAIMNESLPLIAISFMLTVFWDSFMKYAIWLWCVNGPVSSLQRIYLYVSRQHVEQYFSGIPKLKPKTDFNCYPNVSNVIWLLNQEITKLKPFHPFNYLFVIGTLLQLFLWLSRVTVMMNGWLTLLQQVDTIFKSWDFMFHMRLFHFQTRTR